MTRLALAATGTAALFLAGSLGAQLATAGPGFRDASPTLIAIIVVLLVSAVASAECWLNRLVAEAIERERQAEAAWHAKDTRKLTGRAP